jgi:hypothetical protein
MSVCRACHTTNPDFAAVCSACKTPLDKTPGRQPTLPEGAQGFSQRRQTVDDTVGQGNSAPWYTPPKDAYAAPVNPQPAQPQQPGNAPVRRVTIFDGGQSASAGYQQAATGAVQQQPGAAATPTKMPSASAPRKIVGVLVTYTWNDQGQIFPVLEGRNRIGTDPEKCNILVPQDDTLSSVNTYIMFRKTFTIGDEVSMCGTDVDGEPVETPFVPLRNYARIRTGSTHWTFIAIQQQASEVSTEEK